MNDRQIKWLILILPTATIGIWEYVRHTVLLPYISMELGNYLSPLIVFGVSIAFLYKLFSMLEKIQEDLKEERAKKAALEEREKVARELHDGIAQSLFMLSVKMAKLEKQAALSHNEQFKKVKKTLQHVHSDTRQAIKTLRFVPDPAKEQQNTIPAYIRELKQDYQLQIHMKWAIDESKLSPKEKIELFSCVKEMMMNGIKHGSHNEVWIQGVVEPSGWMCKIENEYNRFTEKDNEKGFGLQILKDRAEAMNWSFHTHKENGCFTAVVQKEELRHDNSYSNISSG